MIKDQIVAEVREARQRLFDECNQDLDRLLDRYRASEAEHPERLVDKEAVRARKRTPPPPPA
jgi:hypothetical protein